MSRNMRCRCGDDAFVEVCPVWGYRWGRSWRTLWLADDMIRTRLGALVRCTHEECGREWVCTESGLAKPGVTTPARIVALPQGRPQTREVDPSEPPEPQDGLRGAVRRAPV